jgi:ribosomal protein S12 methylthiotransferase
LKHPHTVSLVSLGCPKNLVDSEGLVGNLLAHGYRMVREPEEADLVIVNTCGFLAASRQESLDVIRGVVELKNSHGVRGVFVAGCMVGNYRELLDREAPGVDRVVGFGDYDRIDRLAEEVLPSAAQTSFVQERRRVDAALTPPHRAYLKISEGCNHTCSFCVIPDIRGAMRSRSIEDLVAQAEGMGRRGVREITLIAQDSTAYGADIYGRPRLCDLLQRLDDVDGVDWIRLMYAYPTEVKDDLAAVLARGVRILPYLDVPVQHVADSVLARMRRGYRSSDLYRMVERLRDHAPDIALRTTVIVGFPGESEADFAALCDFVREVRFDRLGAFRYSREEGSRAAPLDGHLPEELKDERFHRLMALQQEIAFAANLGRVGDREPVLVDSAARGGRPARARSRRDAPEVDAAVLIEDPELRPGDLVEVQVTGASGYDLLGRTVTAAKEPA